MRPMCAREREVGRRGCVAFARSARAFLVLTIWLRTSVAADANNKHSTW